MFCLRKPYKPVTLNLSEKGQRILEFYAQYDWDTRWGVD